METLGAQHTDIPPYCSYHAQTAHFPDHALPYDILNQYLQRLGRNVGVEEPAAPYSITRGTANSVDGKSFWSSDHNWLAAHATVLLLALDKVQHQKLSDQLFKPVLNGAQACNKSAKEQISSRKIPDKPNQIHHLIKSSIAEGFSRWTKLSQDNNELSLTQVRPRGWEQCTDTCDTVAPLLADAHPRNLAVFTA